MTVQRKKPFGNDTQPLSRQITRAASRLDRRHETATALTLSLGSRIRSGLASPGGLWMAGGAGFLLAEWIHRPMNGPRPTRAQPSKPSTPVQTSALSNALLLLRFALDLKILWQRSIPEAPVRAEAAHAESAE